MTAKVDPAAQARLKELAARHGARVQDVLSACLLFMPEDLLAERLKERAEQIEALPKPMRQLLKDLDKLSPADREALKDILG